MSITSPIIDPIYHPPSILAGYGISISSSGNYGSIVSVDLNKNAEFQDLKSKIEGIEKHLCILKPNETLQEKYPALQEAYDAYQLILKIVNDQNSE